MKQNNAVFPGSFDPLTLGHIEVINHALEIFENIIIAVGTNEKKKYMFNTEQRKKFITSFFKNHKRVIIKTYQGLTVDFCKNINVNYIVRGVRNNIDFEYENSIQLANTELNHNIKTCFLPSSKNCSFISSSIVKEIIVNKGDLSSFLPKNIIQSIENN